MFIEEIVETLIRVVDTQLFKTVLTEILEPENVKDWDGVLEGPPGALPGDDLIEPGDQPGEQGGVQCFRYRVPSIWNK